MKMLRDENGLTVGQLIEKLQSFDPETKVWAEGCDCNNPIVDAGGADYLVGVSTSDTPIILRVEL